MNTGVNEKKQNSAEAGETAERLLDAAERLFGEHGYDGVGVRALAEAAKVNLGAATYHFGSKQALYIETFMRRFRPVNAERLERLQAAGAAANGAPLRVETIVDCMIRPPFRLGLRHPDFHVMMARNLFMPPPFLHAALHREIKPNAEAFIEALRRSLPRAPVDLLHLRTMFSMGALTIFSAQMGRMNRTRSSRFDESILQELVRFIAAGMQSEPAVPAADRPPFPSKPFPRPPKPARR
jgi:AcrR family transcriptional regulator